MGQVNYYKMGQLLLQSGVGIINWGNFITKWEQVLYSGASITENASTSSRYWDKWRPMFTERINVVLEWSFI